MSPGLRSAIQSHRDQNSGSPSSSSSSSSHPMMSHMGQGSSQSGGKRRSSKGKKHRRRRSKRAGSNCNKGGSAMGRSRAARGGMMAPGLGAVIKEALVPFGLFAMQKRTQRKKHSGKKFGKSRRRR